MARTGAAKTMAKRKAGEKKAPPNTDDRVAVIVLKGTTAYRDWLNAVSRKTLIPNASIVRDALAKWAEGRGLEAPPEL